MKKSIRSIFNLKTGLFLLVLLFVGSSFSQNKLSYGHLPYKNYPRNVYNGQQQNFGIVETDDHTLIFANNSNILEFDGNNWTKIRVGKVEEGQDSTLNPKSVFKTNAGTILVGCENAFGLLVFNERGGKEFQYLSNPSDKDIIGKIWNIFGNEDEYYFIGEKAIFVYRENQEIETIKYPEGYTRDNASQIKRNLFISLVKKEAGNAEKAHSHLLFNTKTKKFDPFLPNIPEFQNITAVKFITPWKDDKHYLAITQKGQAYSINFVTNHLAKLDVFEMKMNDVLLHAAMQNGLIIFSTEKSGVFIFDQLGMLIRQINDKDGLIDNGVNFSYIDRQNNLWCSTANGISLIELSSPVSSFGKNDGLISKAEDIVYFNDGIFIASGADMNRLARKEVNGKFKGLNFGQPTFNFAKVHLDGEEKILIVGYDGIYSMNKNLEKKSEIPNLYAWKIIQSHVDTNRIYIGTESEGVASAYWDGSRFQLETFYKNTGELIRSLVEFNGEVYYGLSKKGLARLDTTKTQEENIIPGIQSEDLKDFSVAVFQNRLYVGTTDGLYYLSEDGKKLLPFEQFNLVEKDLYVHRVFNEGNKRLWLVLFYKSDSDDNKPVFGYIEPSKDGEWKFVTAPFRYFTDDIVQGFTKDVDGNIWLGADAQTYVVDMDQLANLISNFKINITNFTVTGGESYFENFNHFAGSIPQIEYTQNSVRIEASAQSYYGGAKNQFRFRQNGGNWSEWTDINWKEYQNLDEGVYTVEVQAKDYYGNESRIISITFTILPPWYRTWWAYVIYVIGAIAIIYGLIMLSLYRVKQQKKRLETIVKERTAEIAKQNEVLAEQKDEIELKNQDILDSIKYAKRIQDSILPPVEKMDAMFTDYFVLFKPKDIVSGDFYWAEKIDGKSLFAAVDCTGHGVPGAMVSVVGNNGLNRSVKEFNLRSPGAILDQLREIVIEAFNAQNNMDVKDGMDIALCSIDYENLKLEYSGANNPCVIIRDGEIIETRPDKQPIGQFINKTPFTNTVVDLQKGDTIYVYSDGYVDQFGGDKGKKLKSRPFKNLLLTIQDLPMDRQREKLDNLFEEWRGNYEQIDDVCVFGVKI
ncbi:MAG: SpoIIE family protein phosphatase [Crocinitomicaceae bacterium]|nr:SpoIIE family protein phosphatase [Crocinitomicaceae bacterium]